MVSEIIIGSFITYTCFLLWAHPLLFFAHIFFFFIIIKSLHNAIIAVGASIPKKALKEEDFKNSILYKAYKNPNKLFRIKIHIEEKDEQL